jgi:ATP-dependent Zn protease
MAFFILSFIYEPLSNKYIQVTDKYIKEELNNDPYTFKYIQIDEINNMAYFYQNETNYNETYDIDVFDVYGVVISSKENYGHEINNMYENINTEPYIYYKEEKSISNYLSTFINIIMMFFLFKFLVKILFNTLGSSSSNNDAFGNMLFDHGTYFSIVKNVDTRFTDVIGLKSVKDDLKEYIGYLKNRKKYIDSGFKLPKGLLFIGSPGTGKTLLARALAGESGVTFIPISGSDFLDPYVGGGVKKIQSLFNVARKNTPSIVFIDEIDSIGKKRSSGLSEHGEYGRTLNKLLTEIDGFSKEDEILVIAATNMPNSLDKALTRSGRFDRKIIFDPPNIKERQELFKLYMSKIKLNKELEDNIDKYTDRLAKMTAGMSGADIANIVNHAIGMSLKKSKLNTDNKKEDKKLNIEFVYDKSIDKEEFRKFLLEALDDETKNNIVVKPKDNEDNQETNDDEDTNDDGATYEDIKKAIDEITVGMEKRERTLTEKERNFVAHHEAGHSLTSYLIEQTESPIKTSIVPRGIGALGYSQQEPVDKKLYTKAELFGRICVCMGGRVAEKIMFNHTSTGASNDLEQATRIAYSMITHYGMGKELGPISTELDTNNPYKNLISNQTHQLIDKEAKTILLQAEELTITLLNDNIESLKKMANYLLENEIMDQDELRNIVPNIEGSYDLSTDISI